MSRYAKQAQAILEREILLQHHDDGVNKEQTVHYQVFAWWFFFIAGQLGRLNGMQFSSDYWSMLERNAEFIAALGDNHSNIPQIGDSDDGRVLLLSKKEDDFETLLDVSAVCFERKDFKKHHGSLCEAGAWLLGSDAMPLFEQMKVASEDEAKSMQFPVGGYAILSGGAKQKVKIVFDCGPLGFGSLAAHGHADALSFILTIDDVPLLVDTGTYTYNKNDAYRNYFRSTAAHNTCVVDGQDQSCMTGPFIWGFRAESVFEEMSTSLEVDVVAGYHNGYERLEDPVTHRRRFVYRKQDSVIEFDDEFKCEQEHTVDIYFHFHPDCTVRHLEGSRYQIENKDVKIQLNMDPRLKGELYCECEEPVAGWFSDHYDVKVPCLTLKATGTFTGDTKFSHSIQFGEEVSQEDLLGMTESELTL